MSVLIIALVGEPSVVQYSSRMDGMPGDEESSICRNRKPDGDLPVRG